MNISHRASPTPPGRAAACAGVGLERQARRLLRTALLSAGVTLLGCMQAPDLGAVQAERQKAVLHTDSFQSAASNGAVLAAGTAGGALVTSSDGGKTWARRLFASPASVIALSTCPDGSFVGIDFYRKVWIGDSAAKNWVAHPTDPAVNPLAVTCDAAQRIWVAGSNTTLLSSADHGKTWKTTKLGGDAMLTTIQFIDERHGVSTGEFGIVMTTDDGGATWTRQTPIPEDFYPYSTVFTDARHGWTSGLGGVIQHTTDGGKSWTPQENHSGAPMYTLLHQGGEVYGLGGGGAMVVLRGDEWVRFDHGLQLPAYLAAGAVLNPQSLLVAGAAGALHVVAAPGRLSVAAHQ
ncbi:YCF48-related protein [Methylibium sp.]|uniref:YCF48-related protein n=1 Tax=Methylibium sp. TaxID=2067992 RepID=UPI003D0B7F77